MKRLNVVVAANAMNNWDVLHQGIILEEQYEVFFHDSPRVSIFEGKARFNFDLAITNGEILIDGMKLEAIFPPQQTTVIRRYSKLEQHIRMQIGINELERAYRGSYYPAFEKFVPVNFHHHRQTNGWSHLIDPKTLVVIKPIDGARGIGQIMLDPSKIPMNAAIDALDAFIKDRLTGEELFKELGKYGADIHYSTSGERSPGEGLSCLRNQGFCVQEFVPDIVGEYRLLTGIGGEVKYCQKRTIKAGAFPQATGSDSNSTACDDVVDISTVLDSISLRALNELSEQVIGPLSSIDLFVTADGGWGIFEYCNQFGIKGVPLEVSKKLHADFLLHMIHEAEL